MLDDLERGAISKSNSTLSSSAKGFASEATLFGGAARRIVRDAGRRFQRGGLAKADLRITYASGATPRALDGQDPGDGDATDLIDRTPRSWN
jgi:hypothetical protein